jgi:hypothetical protein
MDILREEFIQEGLILTIFDGENIRITRFPTIFDIRKLEVSPYEQQFIFVEHFLKRPSVTRSSNTICHTIRADNDMMDFAAGYIQDFTLLERIRGNALGHEAAGWKEGYFAFLHLQPLLNFMVMDAKLLP